MHRLQEVIRLHRLGRSRRAIAKQLRMGRNTIRAYLKLLTEAGVLEGPPNELPDIEALREVLPKELATSSVSQPTSVEEWKPRILRLRRKGAGPTAVHDFLRMHEPDYEGSLSAVKRMCVRLDRERGGKPPRRWSRLSSGELLVEAGGLWERCVVGVLERGRRGGADRFHRHIRVSGRVVTPPQLMTSIFGPILAE